MKTILSIQSHVVYGFVGNKAATYPLQNMGFDVLPINTVQFSNHTGYKQWQGQIFTHKHILELVEGLFESGLVENCQAILTGYMGSKDICNAVLDIVNKFKKNDPNIVYLCDPVIGNNNCYVKPEVLDFFQHHLQADIITPNQFEAETLSNTKINSIEDALKVIDYFHSKNIKIVIITGVKFTNQKDLNVIASDNQNRYIATTKEYHTDITINGTGDLFSSTFLGAYLKHKNIITAMQYSIFFLEQAIQYSIDNNSRELGVLSVKYDVINNSKLPIINKI